MSYAGWRSPKGLWTIVVGPDGSSHKKMPLTEKQAKFVRARGGVIFDREAFAEDAETLYNDRKTYSQFGPYRLLVFPREIQDEEMRGWMDS